jgi:SAM-dependent methyltransferase
MVEMDHAWEKIYRAEGRVFGEPFPRFYDTVRTFKDYDCSTIFDLGCGNGRHVVHLAKEGFAATGLDISPTGLGLAQAWLEEEGLQASLVQADMRNPLPIKDESFDGLLSTQVIHHALLAEVRKTIGEIWRILVPGGMAFVTVAGRIHDDTEYAEIEPGTYLPQTGSEAGLPHHIFNRGTLREAFGAFRVKNVHLRDGGNVVTILAQKIRGKGEGGKVAGSR